MKIILFSCVFTLLVLKISGHVLGQSANTRIVGGEPTTIEEHPYQASIEVYGNHHNCGGTILSPNVIITAAQCTVYMGLRFIQVRAGTTERETGGVVRKIEKYYVHELYGLEMGADYDVSLIVLKEPLPLSSKIQPIALPEESEYLNVTEMTTVTGWGELEQGNYEMPNTLHKVSIPVVGQQICKYNYYSGVTERMLCAGYLEEGGKGACGGDIGGPLVAHNKLHGIASWGDGCAKPWYPGVYTRVTAIREWIREKVNL